LWPGREGVARKKHRREKICNRWSDRVSAEWGGPIGRPAGLAYKAMTMIGGKERFARPAQGLKRASWFLRAMPFLPGPARPEIQSS